MSNFVSDNELLLKSWDYKKNIIPPNEASLYSHNKYWWICDKGHSYEQVAYSKAKGIGCPYCSGKLAIKGENDLMTLHPELAKQWDYKKNTQNIETIPMGSQIKVWWICDKGHSYQRSIYDRLHGRGNCSYCSNRLVLKGFNDIATTNPELLSEWNYNKNNELGIYPTEITNGTRTKIWWICDKGHEWDSIARSRITGSGCPYCSNNKVLEGYNDIKTTNPEILDLWNHEKNKDLLPSMFSHGSTNLVWWKCNKGHEWKAKISEVANGNRCPICSNMKVLKGYNDFLTLHPELAKEWDYEKNDKLGIKPDEIIKGGKVKVWWKCNKGHEWESTIVSRIRDKKLYHGCPVCMSYRRTSLPEKIIYFYLKKIFKDTIASYKPDWLEGKEIDIYIPEKKVGIEYDGSYYHKNDERDLIKDTICYDNGVTLIRIREKQAPDISSSSVIFKLKENNKPDGSHVESGIDFLEKYFGINLDYNLDRDIKDILELINFIEKENCISNTHPEVLKEWNYEKNNELGITPENMSFGSALKIWWICEKGHSYNASISTKILQQTGCPYCSSKKVLTGFNDIATTHPNILKEWDYDKNNVSPTEIIKGYTKKVWWKCDKCHSYDMLTINRIKGDGCPYCSGHRVLKGFNDIATLYPELKEQWVFEENEKLGYFMTNFTKGNDTLVWWKCDKGHKYQAKINSKTVKKAGCPYCSGQKVLTGYNDIATTHPFLLKEWDYDKNQEHTPENISKGSKYKVWWKCDKGHSYEASVPNRIKGTGCPYCSNQKILKGFNDIATTHPEVLVNWDYSKNDEIGITPYNISKSYSKKVWWKCNNGHSYQREVYNQRKGYGKCPICKKNKQL